RLTTQAHLFLWAATFVYPFALISICCINQPWEAAASPVLTGGDQFTANHDILTYNMHKVPHHLVLKGRVFITEGV
ncbi:MAG TPA: hypothetical protein VFK47_03845, partial [Ktedonobacteraceae bacterium]|nr:hypothetical protein [Ktedonobacteraceae bacterium]